MQSIQMVPVSCDYMDHQGQNVGYLCLNSDCKEQSTVCFKCSMKSHQQCKGKMKELEAIPNELMEFDLLYNNLAELQKHINKQFLELLSKIQLLIKPIVQYKEIPNLTNLKQIGNMLRSTTKQTIVNQTNSTIKILKQILNDQSCDQIVKQLEVKQNPNFQKIEQKSLFGYQPQLKQNKWQTVDLLEQQIPIQQRGQQQQQFEGYPSNAKPY